MIPETRLRVLCVDDEPLVLEGLSLHLRKRYQLFTAPGGVQALEALIADPSIAIVISDMRMPAMDGATFLARSQRVVPDAVRILLTGQTDISSAIAAVNDGQIFRFLTKPCPPPTLLAAVDAAAKQHQLITAERVLLEETLHGSIKALTDILALANPTSFGRALHIKECAARLAEHTGLPDRWRVEVAAMFSQLGLITLPPATVDRVQHGGELTADEQGMVNRLPEITAQLIGGIPRLEDVRNMLATFRRPFEPVVPGGDPRKAAVLRGGQVLRVAVDFDELEARGESARGALSTMRDRAGRYDPALLKVVEELYVTNASHDEVRELPLPALRVGMVLADDVRLVSGPILVARGYEITERFVERVRNFSVGSVKQPVRVLIRHAPVPVGASEKP